MKKSFAIVLLLAMVLSLAACGEAAPAATPEPTAEPTPAPETLAAEAEELFRHPLHPYTRALLSAVPNPNPYLERSKKLLVYDPSVHDYSVDKPEWCEILPDHFVYGNAPELDGYRKELGL